VRSQSPGSGQYPEPTPYPAPAPYPQPAPPPAPVEFTQPPVDFGAANAGPYQHTPAYPATGYDQTASYGQPVPYGQAAGYGQQGYVVYSAVPPTNGLAIASMIVSILGFGPVGAIMGHIARRQIQERGEQGDGFALAGIIVGWVTTGVWVLCCGGYALALAGMFGAAGLSSV
jgi:hypothetical protein